MPRISDFTEREDQIILDTAGQHIDVVNARLRNAGFAERTAEKVTGRRHYLTKKKAQIQEARHMPSDELGQIEYQRDKLKSEYQQLVSRLSEIKSELDYLTQRQLVLIQEREAALRAELEGELDFSHLPLDTGAA